MTQQLEAAKALLHLHFGHQEFRPGQEEIITDLFNNHQILAIMPTGGGKSLCYQLPALCLDGVTLVISPLISLMKDQVDALTANGVPTTFINSSLSPTETTARLAEIKNNLYKIVYIAPERFYNHDFLNLIKNLNIALVAIDEAHCISQWGHDFRPSYTRIKDFIALLNNHPKIIALTATATTEVQADIVKQLNLNNHKVHITGFNRPNLQYHVIKANDYQKLDYTLEFIQQSSGSGIIYASTREKVNAITEHLQSNGIEAIGYHAGMESDERTQTQNKFMNSQTRVIVATNAFGMGIDKRDIRFVIHFDIPGTVEAYYQEAGRAGRDGLTSHCILFYHPSDRYIREFFINNENPSVEQIKQVYQVLVSTGEEVIRTTYSEIKSQTFSDVSEMGISSIIKILEKYSLIQRPKDQENDAYLKFLTSPTAIGQQLSAKAKSQQAIIVALAETFGEKLQSGVQLKVDSWLTSQPVTKSTFSKTLKTLTEKGLIEYQPPFRGTEIKILQNVLPEQLNKFIDFSALTNKKDQGLKKLNLMETYALHRGCRREYILKYFNDEHAPVKCEGCDYCLK